MSERVELADDEKARLVELAVALLAASSRADGAKRVRDEAQKRVDAMVAEYDVLRQKLFAAAKNVAPVCIAVSPTLVVRVDKHTVSTEPAYGI